MINDGQVLVTIGDSGARLYSGLVPLGAVSHVSETILQALKAENSTDGSLGHDARLTEAIKVLTDAKERDEQTRGKSIH